MEIDHVFLRAKRNSPEADLLIAFGLTEGGGNIHPGQGTENRRFFFRNAFIELLWVSNQSEAKSEMTRATQLYERLTEDSISPFGVCFRPSLGEVDIPFPVWSYAPIYMPKGMSIGIGSDVPLSEPMWFYLEKGMAPGAAPNERRQPLEHAAGVREISSVVITRPGQEIQSAAALVAAGTGNVTILEGDQHLMEITFDTGASGQRYDFRPSLPLVFNY